MSVLRVLLTAEDYEECRNASRLTFVIDGLLLSQQGGVGSTAADVVHAEVVSPSVAHARGLPAQPGARIEFWLRPKGEQQ